MGGSDVVFRCWTVHMCVVMAAIKLSWVAHGVVGGWGGWGGWGGGTKTKFFVRRASVVPWQVPGFAVSGGAVGLFPCPRSRASY